MLIGIILICTLLSQSGNCIPVASNTHVIDTIVTLVNGTIAIDSIDIDAIDAINSISRRNNAHKNNDDTELIYGSEISQMATAHTIQKIAEQSVLGFIHQNTLLSNQSNQSNHGIERRGTPYYYIDSTISCSTNGNFSTYDSFTVVSLSTSCLDSGEISQPCFSNDMFVIGKSITNLTSNDTITGLDIDTNTFSHSPFLSYPHFDQFEIAPFLIISTNIADCDISISPNHLIYTFSFTKKNVIFASDLHIHDTLMCSNSGNILMVQIQTIEIIYKQGVYSLMPYNGDNMFVGSNPNSGILVSPYSSYNNNIIHKLHYAYSYAKSFF